MTSVAVIIPYFQRTGDILRRALESIYRQDVGPDVSVKVLIVDDESPAPPDFAIANLHRPGFSTQIVRRPNGGPGKARNTGLALAGDPDFIAFLDSDDLWSRNHLSTALRCLQRGAQFYFSNNIYGDGVTWMSTLRCADELRSAATHDGDAEYSMTRGAVMPFLLRECLPHTSTVVLDARCRRGLTFDETQSMAGEDYLFWATYVQGCDRVAFSIEPTAERGRGVDVYRSKMSWDHPDCIRCLFHNLTLRKKFLSRFARTEADRQAQRIEIGKLRREISYLFLRNAFRHWRQNWWVASRLLRADPAFWIYFPANAAASLGDRVQARLQAA